MNKKSNGLFAIIFVIFSIGNLWAQIETQREWLLRYAQEQKEKYQRERAEAESIAKSLNLPILDIDELGRTIELQRFENGRPVYYITENLNAAKTISTDKVWPGGSGGFSFTGASEILGIWDAGKVRNTHQELTGRVILGDGASTLSNHATHVAGTMIASGVQANAKGMSYQGSLRAYDWNNDQSEMASAAADGLKVSNHSYGIITGWYTPNGVSWHWYGDPAVNSSEDYEFGFYSEEARNWDNIARKAPYYLIVKSAGNDRLEGPSSQPITHTHSGSGSYNCIHNLDGAPNGYDCISHAGVAKNILTVGAVDDIPNGYSQPSDVVMSSFSCWGPTDDGRIKPDVVANGINLYSCISTSDNTYSTYSGTSMSSPNASGSVGLLLQARRSYWGNNPLRASTIKGLIIHTADEAGSNPGPDYVFGWGLMNTLKAVQVIKADSNAGGNFMIREYTLTNGGQIEFQVLSNGTQPLRVTICWTDTAGTPPSPSLDPPTPMLVNDLDLRVISPTNTTYYPWILDPNNPSAPATTGDNSRDNVEQVYIASPSAGAYTIRINHKGTLVAGPQPVSVIVTGIIKAIKDIQVVAIENPTGTIDSTETPIVPRVRVKNNNSSNETFNVTFKIGSIYISTRSKTLNAGQEDTILFAPWTPVRGTFQTRCSTYLAGDLVSFNDTLNSSVTVQVKNIGVTAIENPVGTIDSTGPITPRARVKNYGTNPESFNVTMRIGSYTHTRTKILNPNAEDTVNFTSWTPVRGTHQVKCSTYLTNDVQKSNDTLANSVTVQVKDVGVIQIITPSGTMDSSPPIIPQVRVKNYGTNQATFDVNLKIGTTYNQTRSKTLNPGIEDTVGFPSWQPIRGTFITRCSVGLLNDAVKSNDTLSKSVRVQIKDIQVIAIESPMGTVDSTSTPVVPRIRVKNNGSETEVFNATFKIGTIYNNTRSKSLASGVEDTVNFTQWVPMRGTYSIRCSVYLAGDMNNSNDTLSGQVLVRVRNVGIVSITAPPETIFRDYLAPKASVKNYGTKPETFYVYCKILDSLKTQVYLDSSYVSNLNVNATSTRTFKKFYFRTGSYEVRCSTALYNDANLLNDVKSKIITVKYQPPWVLKESVPQGPSGKAVKGGGALVAGEQDKIYALKGNNTREFYVYFVDQDSWALLESMPFDTLSRKKVNKGATLAYNKHANPDIIYATKGNNTLEFWAYNVELDTWIQKPYVPVTYPEKKVKGGAAMVYLKRGQYQYIYFLKGNKTLEFYAYHCDADTWIRSLTQPPPGPNIKPFRDGSCMTVGKNNKIYALKGGANINEFYRYDPTANAWETLPVLPIYSSLTDKNTKVKDGAALCYDGDSLIYAFKGGNRQEFWVFNINQNRWQELDTVPRAIGRKKISSGAGLAFADDKVFALKGNKTREFWSFNPVLSDLFMTTNYSDISQTYSTLQERVVETKIVNDIRIKPNLFNKHSKIEFNLSQPSLVKLALYNSLGQLLTVIANEEFPIGSYSIPLSKNGLSAGIYFLKCEISQPDASEKMIKRIKLIIQ
ncbi:MAG: S8 family serine peptidase [candidate division WOR-3 bacterium]|nr:S8 family serine peptidase [candidate division WOR-3 bacterium]